MELPSPDNHGSFQDLFGRLGSKYRVQLGQLPAVKRVDVPKSFRLQLSGRGSPKREPKARPERRASARARKGAKG